MYFVVKFEVPYGGEFTLSYNMGKLNTDNEINGSLMVYLDECFDYECNSFAPLLEKEYNKDDINSFKTEGDITSVKDDNGELITLDGGTHVLAYETEGYVPIFIDDLTLTKVS